MFLQINDCFCSKHLRAVSLQRDSINGYTVNRSKNVIDIMMSSVLRIQGITISFEMDGKKKQLSAFADKINQERIQSKSAGAHAANSSVGSLDDLEKLANLMDKGIITAEEFETKKKQILGL